MSGGLEYMERALKQQERLQKQKERIRAAKEEKRKENVVQETDQRRFEGSTARVEEQKELERQRSLTAEKRAHAEEDISKWGRRRAKWDNRQKKYW